VNELVKASPAAQQAAWGSATTAFALVQAAAGYFDSFLLTATGGDFTAVFGVAGAAFAVALGWDLGLRPAPLP
jgi:hypothetical protein